MTREDVLQETLNKDEVRLPSCCGKQFPLVLWSTYRNKPVFTLLSEQTSIQMNSDGTWNAYLNKWDEDFDKENIAFIFEEKETPENTEFYKLFRELNSNESSSVYCKTLEDGSGIFFTVRVDEDTDCEFLLFHDGTWDFDKRTYEE